MQSDEFPGDRCRRDGPGSLVRWCSRRVGGPSWPYAPASSLRTASLSSPRRSEWPSGPATRSEEHTSELQSRFDLVCRLLLEKKNKIKTQIYIHDVLATFSQ